MVQVQRGNRESKESSSNSSGSQTSFEGGVIWTTEEHLRAHESIAKSGLYNFEGCQIPIPTNIRYDRLRVALGSNVSPKDERTLNLLKFGLPIDCQDDFGVKKPQKNHYSAIIFKESILEYLNKSVKITCYVRTLFRISNSGLML